MIFLRNLGFALRLRYSRRGRTVAFEPYRQLIPLAADLLVEPETLRVDLGTSEFGPFEPDWTPSYFHRVP